MPTAIASFILCAFIAFVFWIIGSLFPAPQGLLNTLHARAAAERLHDELATLDVPQLRKTVGDQRFQDIASHAAALATAAGKAITVEHQDNVDMSEALAQPDADSAAKALSLQNASLTGVASKAFETALSLCPGMEIHNAPAADASRRVLHYAQTVNVQGVKLAVDPTHGTCLSSGFGLRGSEMHKGIDFYDRLGGQILAGADGKVIEMKYRDDYGNMVLLDHGHGVYTRYAHMSAFAKGLAVGSQVQAGQMLGLMGNTASYPIPIHLHYELLLGDYNNPKQSFGLAPHSVFEFVHT
jgi:murein DD-endopeptidase MepM/ murein hydrolase activator NlpD